MRKFGKISINPRCWNQEYKDIKSSRCIGIYILLNEFNTVVQHVFELNGAQLVAVRLLISAYILITFIVSVLHFRKKEFSVLVLFYIGIAILFLYSFLLGVKFSLLADLGITTFGICIPLGVIAFTIQDRKILFDSLYKYSWPILVLLFIDLLGSSKYSYDMHFSYILLFVIIMHISKLLRSKKMLLIPIVMIEIVLMIAYGSRGAVICLGVYLLLKITTNMENREKKVFYIFFIIMFSIVFVIILNNFGYQILAHIQQAGFRGRSLQLLLNGNFAQNDSGRGIIWENAITLIKQKPILGWGIRGAASILGHPYPHQLFLDYWLAFGCIFGSVLIILTTIPLKNVFLGKAGIEKEINQIFFSMAFVSLMFSGTVFTSYTYFIMLGLLLSTNKYVNINSKNER